MILLTIMINNWITTQEVSGNFRTLKSKVIRSIVSQTQPPSLGKKLVGSYYLGFLVSI